MPTVRDIPEIEWEWMAQALRVYFTCRGEAGDADDLAQRTFEKMLERDDYNFAEPKDFRPVCYGFAVKVLQSHRRAKARLPETLPDRIGEGSAQTDGAKANENRIFLQDVMRVGQQGLTEDEWIFVQEAANAILEGTRYNFAPPEANRMRVLLHRLRKKLTKITGWKTL